ncbi:alpha-ketoacid dehydrogenase subunit beta [Chloroflexota bacterium]
MNNPKPHYAGKVDQKLSQGGTTFRAAIASALKEEMLRDESVFLIGEDIGRNGGAFGATLGLYEQFGEERVRDTPIAETAIIGLATGAALLGMRPVAEIMFMDFIFTAMDQIVNNVAKMRYIYGEKGKLPLVIRTACGAGLNAGPTHGQSLYSMFMHVHGLKVAAPSTPYEAKGLLISAIRDDYPVLFLENMSLYRIRGPVPDNESVVPMGKGIVRTKGQHITIVATMAMMHAAMAAAAELNKEGVSLEVIDPCTLIPFDTDTVLESVRKTGRLIIADESPLICSLQSEISAIVVDKAFDYLDAPPVRLGTLAPIPFSPPLESAVLPGKESIIREARKLMQR